MIENFEISNSFRLQPYAGRYGLTFAKFIDMNTKKVLRPIRIDRNLKAFMNENDRGKSFSLAIAVDKSNKELFKKLEHSLSSWLVLL